MKKVTIFLASIFLVFIAFLELNYAQTDSDAPSVENRLLNAQIARRDYYLLEPIDVDFDYTVLASDGIPQISQDVQIKIFSETSARKFTGLSQYVIQGRPERLPVPPASILNLNTSNIENTFGGAVTVTIDRVAEFFPEPGMYGVQFALFGAETQTIEIKVLFPKGLDKEAYDLLISKEGNISFQWVWSQKNGIEELETFVKQYGQSTYGDFAVLHLANIYFQKGFLEKSKSEFHKIIASERLSIANEAQSKLLEIETKLKAKQN